MENLANTRWYNELGSVMILQVNGNTLTGTYQTKVGNARGIYQLIGLINTANNPSNAMGWTVVWQNQYGNSNSVTGWSGQFQTINGTPTILTTWLLTSETNPPNNWRSTIIGQDVFTPIQKTEAEIAAHLQKGLHAPFPALM